MELIKILEKYNIDGFHKKGGTDKNSSHSYVEIYEKLFSQYKNKRINLLEIGIQYGGSILLWQDYFKHSNLYFIDNVDIMDDNVKKHIDYKRCKIYKMDAYTNISKNILKKDNPDNFDIIIDDGPHTKESQSLFIKKYFNLLNDNGIMIIEDVDYLNLHFLKTQIPVEYKNKLDIYDLRKIKNRYDDILFVIKK